ncbi:MAG: type I secretion system permease/ATPase [Pseudomonadota bacterium]
MDSGLQCLAMMARFHGIATDPDHIAHQHRVGAVLTQPELLTAAKELGMRVSCVRVKTDRLSKTPLPAIAQDKNGSFFILAKVEADQVLIHCPIEGRPQTLSIAALDARWNHDIILLTSQQASTREAARFDFSWFIPAIIKYRKFLIEVLIVSFFLQFFALITPLFFQVVMDKVLVHQSLKTLDVIGFAFLIVIIFEITLSFLRTYIFSHTTSRMDVELGARLFRHLMHLPLGYFQARRIGDSVARVRELENIRAFLTGNTLTLILDCFFSFLFIAVMLYYSTTLTWIVLASLPCYFILSLIITPILKSRLHEKFNRGAENQAFLVETISGVDTLKAMAVEPQWTRQWDQQLAGYVSASFRTNTLSSFAQGGVGLISKLVTLAILYFGAKLVISGQLSIGQLIAFNMLAGQVSQPVMRLAQLWTDFQQVGISMERLGDILNTKTEVVDQKSTMPQVQGEIVLKDVIFRYRPDGAEALKNINLTIHAGEMIGVVGRSGSGKSTLTKIIQRLYVPERGRVFIDGIDIAVIDPASLRRQIGIVQQDNILFSRSVRDNIALADPGAPLEKIMEAARLAGAHDFITELPEGYDTLVGEHGASLSGGQRQRVAIARALLNNPAILIFDEATSALDYESEHIIQQNMQAIGAHRTVIIIAHRLSAVRHAHRIVVLDKGVVVEEGTHNHLITNAGTYAHLYKLQQQES